MPSNVHDVVEVSRPAPLSQRPEFLGEQFNQGVTENACRRKWRVAVRVGDWPKLRALDENFVIGEVQLDLR